ncbi:Non-specific lipid transfer protein GPI-anchored 13-like protein [Drosera capensis]
MAPYILLLLLFITVPSLCSGDLAQDKQECGPQLIGLSPCLAYAETGSTSKAPTADCCGGVKQVLVSSMKCVCLLAKYKDDKSLGLDVDIDRALGLPAACHATANISQCTALLHLAPNSSLAKVFNDFAKKVAAGTSTNTTAATSASPGIVGTTSSGTSTSSGATPAPKNDAGKGRTWLAARQMAYGIVLSMMVYNYIGYDSWNFNYV